MPKIVNCLDRTAAISACGNKWHHSTPYNIWKRLMIKVDERSDALELFLLDHGDDHHTFSTLRIISTGWYEYIYVRIKKTIGCREEVINRWQFECTEDSGTRYFMGNSGCSFCYLTWPGWQDGNFPTLFNTFCTSSETCSIPRLIATC